MKHLNLILISLLALMFFSCERDEGTEHDLNLEKVTGFVQKGPFLNRTAVTINTQVGTTPMDHGLLHQQKQGNLIMK